MCNLSFGKSAVSLVVVFLIFVCQLHAIEHPFQRMKKEQNRYNMTVSDTHQFVWFRVAKVGTRSIFQVLENNQVEFAVNGANIPFKPRKHKDYFKFAFVRNPWARVVSCYFDKVKEGHNVFEVCFDQDFECFVDFIAKQDLKTADRHIRLQTALIPVDEVDFIGHTENFANDMRYVMTVLGFANLEIPHKHSSQHEHYSHYYTERTKKIIARKYKKDIEAFGYTFEYK